MIKQWEREQARTKPQKKAASKTNTGDSSSATGSVPTSTTLSTTVTEPPAAPSQVPVPPPPYATLPALTQPHPPPNFPTFPGFSQDIPLHPQTNNTNAYLGSMFTRNMFPYSPFGPSLGPHNFPMYPQNPYQYYPPVESYCPAGLGENWFPAPASSHPLPSGSHSHRPIHHASFPEPHHGQGPTNHQPQVPTHPPSPGPSHRVRSGQHNPASFPTLQEWFARIDDDPVRGAHGDDYSQYSHTFDLHGFETLLDLEGLRPDQLFEQFAISQVSACRLLTFANEDIWSIRASDSRTR